MTLPEPYYVDEACTIYHGDCREILPLLPKVDLVCTDPPYGIGASRRNFLYRENKAKCAKAFRKYYGEGGEWDGQPPSADLIDCVISSGRKAIIFGGNFFGLPASTCWFVWDKDNGSNRFADCELVWTNLPGAVRKIRYRWSGMLQEKMGCEKEERYHPTQKPLDVMTWAISQAPDDCLTILDPFMGSGTTLRAAKDLSRRAIGIEISEAYCEIARQRLRQEVLAL